LKVKRFLHELATAAQFNSWARSVGLDDARSVFWCEISTSPSGEKLGSGGISSVPKGVLVG
jgi:hypothetical protein